jgi:hypothetical protein
MKRSSSVLLLTAVLTACGSDPVTPPVTPPVPAPAGNLVQGQLAAWPYAAAELRVDLLAGDRWAPASPAVIAASGAVNATLPDPVLQRSLFDGCTLPAGFNPDGVGVDLGALNVFSAQNDLLGSVFETTADGQPLLRLYASAAVSLKGSAVCDGDQLNVDVAAQAGWNLVQVSVSPDGTLTLVSAASGTQPRLRFELADARVVVVPVNSAPLTILRGESVDVPVKLYQVGGVSGTVELLSGRSGLQITPASVALPGHVGMQAALSRPAAHTLRSALPAALWTQLPQPGLGAQGLRPQALTTTLKVEALPWAPTQAGPVPIEVRRGGQPLGGGSLESVSVVAPSLIMYGRPGEVDQGAGSTLEVNLYPQTYRGQVTVTVQGLPTGVSVQPQTITVTGSEALTVQLPVTAPAGQEVGHFPVTLVATEQTTGLSVTNRQLLSVMSPRVRLAQGGADLAIDGTGNLWTSGYLGMVRHRADGTFDVFAHPGSRCGSMIFGDDGGIWQMSSPQVRFDAVTGEGRELRDPRGFSGCAGWGMRFDAQGRGWAGYDGIQRLDYTQNRAERVPGSQEDRQLLDVEGTSVWASTFVAGGPQLVRIDSNTLARQTFALPGITNAVTRGYAVAGKVWLPGSVPGRLVSFDPATGNLSAVEVRIGGQLETEFDVLGVDAQGRHWLQLLRGDAELAHRDWVLYDPTTEGVVRQVPGFYGTVSGEPVQVAPDGTLWALNTSQGTQPYTYAHIYRP